MKEPWWRIRGRGLALTASILALAGAALAGGPRGVHRFTRVVTVKDGLIVVRAGFELHEAAQKWISVYFQARLDADTPVVGADGKEILRMWDKLFPPANASPAVYDDVRMGLKLSDFQGARNVPRGKRTLVWIVCDLWDAGAGKYISNGWSTRTSVVLRTDMEGRILDLSAADLGSGRDPVQAYDRRFETGANIAPRPAPGPTTEDPPQPGGGPAVPETAGGANRPPATPGRPAEAGNRAETEPPDPAPVQPGAATPVELLRRMAKAIKARDRDRLKSCFPQRTEAECTWAEGRCRMILAVFHQQAWWEKVMDKFPRGAHLVLGGRNPDPGREMTLELTHLAAQWRADAATGDEAQVSMPGPPGPFRKPHRLVRVDGRWFYRSWNFGQPTKMMEGGETLKLRAQGLEAHLDRAETLLDDARSAAELKQKLSTR
jgi:hypothetical protein